MKIILPAKNNKFVERSIMGALSFLKDAVFADEYAAKKGFLQAKDPRVKALTIFLMLLAVLFSKSIIFIACMYVFCLLLASVSSIELGFFLKRTWLFIPLFAFFIAIPALFTQGLFSALIFFLRVLTSVSLCVLLTLTTKHYVLLKVLGIFKVPQVFVMTLSMCYRYVYLFIEIIQNTYLAIKSRGGYFSSPKKGQRVVAWNIASLWQRSFNLHNQVYAAMLSRGYNGETQVLDEFQVSLKDLLWLAVILFLFLGTIWQTYFLN